MTESATAGDVDVVGAGLAGLTLANALQRSGFRVRLFDDGGPRASHIPVALLHPFSGRSVSMTPDWEDAFSEACTWLSDAPHARRCTMVRPLLGEAAPRLERSVERNEEVFRRWEGRWLDSCADVDSSLTTARGIAYSPAWVVNLPALLGSVGEGLEVITAPFDATDAAGTVVFATGAGLGSRVEGLRLVGGHVAAFEADLQLEAAVSGGVHAVRGPDGLVWVGATFWEGTRPSDEEAGGWLEERALGLFRRGARLTRVRVWGGVRAVHHPDRRPLVGRLGREGREHVFGAFGSRGLGWIPWCAQRLVDHLRTGVPLPEAIDAARARPR